MSTEIVPANTAPPAVQTAAVELVALQSDVLLARRQAVEKTVREVMVPGVHYGEIPGVQGKSLLKPGTEVLMATFQLAVTYAIETVPDEDDGRRYVVEARISHQPSGIYLGSGMGECSTNESKWKWRSAHEKEANDTPADRRRKKYKRDGGSYWQVRQEVADVGNTVLKQACKRAAADAVLAVLGVRGVVLDAELLDGQRTRPQPARQSASVAKAKAGPENVKRMTELAAAKGLDTETILARLKAGLGYNARTLAPIAMDEYEWVMAGLAELPDVDGETGEVIEGAVVDVDDGEDFWPKGGES